MARQDSETEEFYRSKNRPFAIWKAALKGYRDGFQGRPVKLADGMLDSEYIRATLAHCEQDLSVNWSVCLARVNSLESGIALRQKELDALNPQIEQLRAREERIRSAADLTQRKPGEEALDDGLVKSRRTSEMKRELAPLQNARSAKEERACELDRELCGLRRKVADLENITALHCNCLVNECDEILARYVRTALRAMKNPIDPPWTLPRVRLDGQRLYMASRPASSLVKAGVDEASRGIAAGIAGRGLDVKGAGARTADYAEGESAFDEGKVA